MVVVEGEEAGGFEELSSKTAEVITSSLNAPASTPFKPPPLLDRFVATNVVEVLFIW